MERRSVDHSLIMEQFDQLLSFVCEGNEVVIVKDGRETAVLMQVTPPVSLITDALTGILKQEDE